MDHLKKAKEQAKQSEYIEDVKEATYSVHLAITHALIAICERMDETAKHAELEAEQAESAHAYQVSRDLY